MIEPGVEAFDEGTRAVKQKRFTQQMRYALGCGGGPVNGAFLASLREMRTECRHLSGLAANAFAVPIASQAERDFRKRQMIEILESFSPDLPQATLFNDVPAALFFLNAFLVVVGRQM